MKMCFVVPVYNHGKALEGVVSNLEKYKVPVIVVDDGNDAENKSFIRSVADAHKSVVLVERPKNGGKGKAVTDGIRQAHRLGFTHAFQIDSDGQHDTESVARFLEEAEKFPDDLICGFPVYDESVPAARKNGREVSNKFARFCTLDKSLVDVLCGYRIYPVMPVMKLLNGLPCLTGAWGMMLTSWFIWCGAG